MHEAAMPAVTRGRKLSATRHSARVGAQREREAKVLNSLVGLPHLFFHCVFAKAPRITKSRCNLDGFASQNGSLRAGSGDCFERAIISVL